MSLKKPISGADASAPSGDDSFFDTGIPVPVPFSPTHALVQSVATSPLVSNAVSVPSTSVLDTSLARLLAAQTAAGAALTSGIDDPSVPHASSGTTFDGQYVVIDATAKDHDGAALLTQLEGLGLLHGASFGSMASGLMPVSQISGLLGIADLSFARQSLATSSLASQGSVVTQADSAETADLARSTYNVDGTGFKVGVISDSFNTSGNADTMATDISTSDLPADTTILQDFAGGTDEGRGMAQLVHDIAPGSSIEFATGEGGMANFAANIVALAAAGAKIIVDDLIYFAEPAYQDGVIAQAVDQVVAGGAIYFSSAGNNAHHGYEAPVTLGATTATVSGRTEQFLDFAPGQNGLPIVLGSRETMVLEWNQPAESAGGAGATGDLDFFLYDNTGTFVTGFDSIDSNIGHDPFEILGAQGASGQTYFLRVGYHGGTLPTEIKVIILDNGTGAHFDFALNGITNNTNDGTAYGHTAAAGAISVGAASFASTPAFGVNPPVAEAFSSGGPTTILFDTAGNALTTPDVRQTPDITAPDRGNTTFFGTDSPSDTDTLPNFAGTSAAAPDAAGAAALMLQVRSGLTAADVQNLLRDSSIDMDNPATAGFDTGYDYGTGSGLIQADKAVGFASTLNIAATAAHPVMLGTHFADTFSGGAENDTFTGNGASDTLIFTPGGLADTFTDFVAGAGGDVVDLTAFTHITSLQAVLNRASQPGADTIIDLGNGDTITLTGVTKGNLTTANFVLAPNNAPVITSDSGGATATLAIAENTSAVTAVSATDQDEATTLGYAIVGGADQGRFQIDGTTGALSFLAAPDFEAPTDSDQNNAYIVQVRVSDGTLFDDQTITINVTNVNDNAPVAKNDDFTTNEATAIGSVLSIFNNNGYGPDTDPDNSSFSVSAVNGSAATVGTTITLASGAHLTVNAGGTFNYDPNHAFDLLPAAGSGATNLTATDTFTYTTTDGSFTSNTAAATVTISGVDSDDLLQGSFSAGTTLAGGIGNDTYVPHNSATAINDTSGTKDVVYVEGLSYSLAAFAAPGIEAMIVENGSGITGTGYGATANTLYSLSSAGQSITLVGGSAADYISGGLGSDSLQGGLGNDLYVVHATGTAISDGGGAVDIAYVEGVDFALVNGDGIDDVVLENGAGHAATGHSGEATALYSVDAAGQSNTLIGGGAADMLVGGLGSDHLQGGGGNDTYVAYGAGTTIADTGGADVLYAEGISFSLTDGDGIEALVVQGSGLTGTGHSTEATSLYSLDAAGESNTLIGGSGADLLVGGLGNDSLQGGEGDDVYVVNSAGTTVSDLGSTTADVVYAESVNYALSDGDGIENLILEGNGHTATGHATTATTVYSTGSGNTLVGGTAGDILVAGAAGDTLIGNGGNDSLVAGAGNDTFTFGANIGQSLIYGFHVHDGGSNQDTIQLTGEPAGTSFASMVANHQIFEAADAAEPSGSDVFVAHDASNYVVLLNHHLADLSASDFLFA